MDKTIEERRNKLEQEIANVARKYGPPRIIISGTLDTEDIKKTSKEWNDICTFNIIDHDGWDRKNFDYSWNEELITYKEFIDRVMHSTIYLKIVR